MQKTVLITGGGGYVGSVLVELLLSKNYKVIVLDRFFFGKESLVHLRDSGDLTLIKEDIRYFDPALLNGVHAVIDLAGISNDPACELDTEFTESVNLHGSLRVARLSREAGVKRYLFASSCSVYGHGSKEPCSETSPLNPVSLYAKCKLKVEEQLASLFDDRFCITTLRKATVFGYSPRMRFDLVINIMTLNAYVNRKIHVLGGGYQWRPLIHVKDVARAYLKILEAPPETVNGKTFNIGSNDLNYQVYQIAYLIRDVFPNIDIDKVDDDPDTRTYNVAFDTFAKMLDFAPEYTATDGILEVKKSLEAGWVDPYDKKTSTLKYYKYLLEAEKVIKEVSYKGRIF